jgi:hypothetical protein
MSRILPWLRENVGSQPARPVSAFWQYVFHVLAVYAVAEYCMPWLSWVIYEKVLPTLLHTPLNIGVSQFFSHLMIYSALCGLLAGTVNAKLFPHPVVRFVWVVPVVVLILAFVFMAPGMYPTMILQSDFGKAFHYFFGGGFDIPANFLNFRQAAREGVDVRDVLRGLIQLRYAVPAYVGVAYSFGAWLSINLGTARPRLGISDSHS